MGREVRPIRIRQIRTKIRGLRDSTNSPRSVWKRLILDSVADPGFPVAGTNIAGGGGGADVRCGRLLAKACAKMKELGPILGGGAPPRPANVSGLVMIRNVCAGKIKKNQPNITKEVDIN